MPRDLDAWLRIVLLLAGVALGILLRVEGVGGQALFGDEYHTLYTVEESYGTILATFDNVGSHIVLPLLQRLCLDVVGDGVVSMRLPALVPGILTLLLLYPLARRLVGATPACLATLALSFSPMHVYYSRFGRPYALMILLGLLLVVAVPWALRSGGKRAWACVGVLAVLLPYTHLSSGGFVLAVGLVALVLGRLEEGSWRGARAPLVAFGAAAAVVVLLFVPLLSQLGAFFDNMPDERSLPLGWVGIPLLLAGGRLAALLGFVAFPLGLVGLWRQGAAERRVALLSLAALLGPLLALVGTLPHGMDYAYARYLLNALPFVFMVIAWLFAAALDRHLRRPSLTLLAGAALVALLGLGTLPGPLASQPGRTGTFGNTYLAMWPLPAFDVPHPNPSPFYAELAADPEPLRVIESQPLLSRAVLLYRNYALMHGKEVLVGWWEDELQRAFRRGPYAWLREMDALDADYLIYHKDLRREVRNYWRFVYLEAWPDHERWGDESMMERHRANFIGGQRIADPEFAGMFIAELERQLGPPTYEDEKLLAWKLRP